MKINKPHKLTEHRWLNLFEVEYTSDRGHQGKWAYVSRKTAPNPGPEPIKADAVIIVPLLKEGRSRKLVMIREFRMPIGDYEYSVPAGLYDPNENLFEVVQRELKEETGLLATKILLTSQPVISSAGLSDEAVEFVFVECSGVPDTSHNEGAEEITVEILDIEGIKKLRRSQVKISAKVWPILLLFEAMGKIALPRGLQ